MTAKILLVDDDKSVREVGLFNLRRAGYETVPAEGGLEALSLFSREDFDLVITDVKMPGISGIELVRRIHAMAPCLPIIVITAFGGMETALEAMREGACYFIAKPFGRAHLQLAVEKALGRRCLADEAEALQVPLSEVERGIVCVFPNRGGSLLLQSGLSVTDTASSQLKRNNNEKRGWDVKTVTVYRVDYVKRTRVPIGEVHERRKENRGGNYLSLLRLARKIYGKGPEDALHIAVDIREARRAWTPPDAFLPNPGEEYSSAG